ncbi:MAG: CHAT domain-containing protein, partial [Alphaproteobacteria bacterium]|nr:CHAT domain-containing protein [Alphaproteobacteria bacterium]
MTFARTRRAAALCGCCAVVVGLAGCATAPRSFQEVAVDSFDAGRNSQLEACTASRSFADRGVSGLFNASYAITCRNASASRAQGFVRLFRGDARALSRAEATLACGDARPVDLPGLGKADARRCFDSAIGGETLALRAERGGVTIVGSGYPGIAGPLVRTMRWAAGAPTAAATADKDVAPIALASLPAPPEAARPRAAAGDFDPGVALQQGIAFNHRGMHIEASRVLNDALSRLPADADPALRAELSLEAGLADSNISFAQSAQEHFARANALIDGGVGARRGMLVRKRDIYVALDLLNRRQFRKALAALDQLASRPAADQPLLNLALVRSLNQRSGASDLAGSVAFPDTETLYQLVMDAQANWARSVALLGLGDLAGSQAALAAADAAFAPLGAERIQQGPVLWLKARLERQRGRLAARRGQWAEALASFDRAGDALTLGAVETGGTGREPAIAEMRLERAAVVAQQGGPAETVRRAYGEAIDAMIAAGSPEGVVPRGLDTYLDLLVADAKAGRQDGTDERFFRAVQSIGEPAVARQLSRIERVVTADPAVAAKVREREDLTREITRLRYRISDAPAADAAARAELETQRRTAEERLARLDGELGGNARLGSVEERPATIAEIRAALRPGELFWKVSEIGRGVYGIAVSARGTTLYRAEAPAAALAQMAARLRGSIDGQIAEGKMVQFDVPVAALLFDQLAGPAKAELLAARALVVDPSGPLERLPAGVLVTDKASIAWRDARRRDNAWDYSGVSFLAAKASISTAVSPRSFLVARALPASTAPKPFIGFAEHVVPARGAQLASAGRIDVGNVCSVEFTSLRDLAARMNPVDRQEVVIAANALGAVAAPVVAGAEFTDSAVRARGDLDQYEVLHFATHGLEEGVWGCSKSPPALVTSFGGPDSDGLLSFDEIAGLHLDANLVVLSACDTAAGIRSQALARQAGQEEAGSTLAGLVRAFLTANARAVMATHWQVPAKEGTYDFIRAFYGNARTRDIGTALEEAQRTLIARPEYSHPFYW